MARLALLADVLELIKVLDLPVDFTGQLDPFVRERFLELWGASKEGERLEESGG
jgi:hypothetical protein